MILDGRFSVFPYYVTLFLNICSILRESNIIHKKIRDYLEEKRCPITKCSKDKHISNPLHQL